MKMTRTLPNAFEANNAPALKKIHLFLNHAYHATMFSETEVLDEIKHNHLKRLEKMWMRHEVSECIRKYNCQLQFQNKEVVERALTSHPVYHHPLFSYLQRQASENELKEIFYYDSILNLEFFDYLALAIVGTSKHAKAEIIKNMWDEAGKGHIERFHTSLYQNLLNDLNISYDRTDIIKKMSWQAVAGINLFSYFSLYPFNKMKLYGLLAATELLDPSHYHQLIIGMQRVFENKKINLSYYQEHEIVDVHHANGWLEQVVLPALAEKPQQLQDFWVGFYLRLDSVKSYYDVLMQSFVKKRAA